MAVALWIGYYLSIGIIALSIFEMITHRITNNIRNASYRSQEAMAGAGAPVSSKAAIAVILVVMWIFWPFVFIGAFTKKRGKK